MLLHSTGKFTRIYQSNIATSPLHHDAIRIENLLIEPHQPTDLTNMDPLPHTHSDQLDQYYLLPQGNRSTCSFNHFFHSFFLPSFLLEAIKQVPLSLGSIVDAKTKHKVVGFESSGNLWPSPPFRRTANSSYSSHLTAVGSGYVLIFIQIPFKS